MDKRLFLTFPCFGNVFINSYYQRHCCNCLVLLFFFCVKVIFEGVRGQGYQGDIAIDDVQFTVGSCPVLPSGAKPSNPWTTPAVSTVPTTTVPTPGN